jgi:hypothetical protein
MSNNWDSVFDSARGTADMFIRTLEDLVFDEDQRFARDAQVATNEELNRKLAEVNDDYDDLAEYASSLEFEVMGLRDELETLQLALKLALDGEVEKTIPVTEERVYALAGYDVSATWQADSENGAQLVIRNTKS